MSPAFCGGRVAGSLLSLSIISFLALGAGSLIHAGEAAAAGPRGGGAAPAHRPAMAAPSRPQGQPAGFRPAPQRPAGQAYPAQRPRLSMGTNPQARPRALAAQQRPPVTLPPYWRPAGQQVEAFHPGVNHRPGHARRDHVPVIAAAPAAWPAQPEVIYAQQPAAEPPLTDTHGEPPVITANPGPCAAPLIIQIGANPQNNVHVVQAQAHSCSVPQVIQYRGARVHDLQPEVIPAPRMVPRPRAQRHAQRHHRHHGFRPVRARY